MFYPPNLTPDPATGLGRWTEAQVARAIRHGEKYLRSLPPVARAVPLPVPEGQRPPAPYLDVVVPR